MCVMWWLVIFFFLCKALKISFFSLLLCVCVCFFFTPFNPLPIYYTFVFFNAVALYCRRRFQGCNHTREQTFYVCDNGKDECFIVQMWINVGREKKKWRKQKTNLYYKKSKIVVIERGGRVKYVALSYCCSFYY